jgi:hypothetical protein
MTTVTRGDTDQSSRVTALAAIYAAERQDSLNALTATLAVLAAAATYIVAVLAFARSVSAPFFWLIAPMPAWAALSVQLMIMALAATRAKSIFILEGELVQSADLVEQHKNLGYVVGEEVMNFHLQPLRLRINNIFAYSLEVFVIICFSIYCAFQFLQKAGPFWAEGTPTRWTALWSVLAILWILVALGWAGTVTITFAHISKIFDEAYKYRQRLIKVDSAADANPTGNMGSSSN